MILAPTGVFKSFSCFATRAWAILILRRSAAIPGKYSNRPETSAAIAFDPARSSGLFGTLRKIATTAYARVGAAFAQKMAALIANRRDGDAPMGLVPTSRQAGRQLPCAQFAP